MIMKVMEEAMFRSDMRVMVEAMFRSDMMVIGGGNVS